MISDRDHLLWMGIRQALLLMVDFIERYLDIPRTAEKRKHIAKEQS